MPSTRSQRRRPSVRSQRRQAGERRGGPQQKELEPIDYSQDYAYVRKDLQRIVLWGGLLFGAMIAYFLYLQFLA